MQRLWPQYGPALDGGGSGAGAGFDGGMGDDSYAELFETNDDFMFNFPNKPPQGLSPMPPRTPWTQIPTPWPLNEHGPEASTKTSYNAYPYFLPTSFSLNPANTSNSSHTLDHDVHSPTSTVPAHPNDYLSLSMYHHEGHHLPVNREVPVGQIYGLDSSASGWPPIIPAGYNRHEPASVPPWRDKESQNFNNEPLMSAQADRLSRLGSHTSALGQGAASYGPSSIQADHWHLVSGQATERQRGGAQLTLMEPGFDDRYSTYQLLDSTRLHSSTIHIQHSQNPQTNHSRLGNLRPGTAFDSVGVGTTPVPDLYSPGHSVNLPDGHRHDLSHSPGFMRNHPTGLSYCGLVPASQHDKVPPDPFNMPPERSICIDQANNADHGDVPPALSPTSVDGVIAPTRARSIPERGRLNTFLSSPVSGTRSRAHFPQCRPEVISFADVPRELRLYYKTDKLIPRSKYDTLYRKDGDGEFCVFCGYNASPPRRTGLKYEHGNAHLDNRPYYCLICNKGHFRKSGHSKKDHPPLWRPMSPPSP